MENQTKQKLLITRGLPASGKTTYAKNWVEENPEKRIRVEKDEIRKDSKLFIDGVYNKERGDESIVVKERDRLIHSALSRGFSVVSSDTNLNSKNIVQLQNIAKQYDAELEIKEFYEISLRELIERDKNRSRSVGENTIRDLFYKYVKVMPTYLKFNAELPFVIVCDIDGTLTLDQKSKKLNQEEINIAIAHILDAIKIINYAKIILITKRDMSLETQTKDWLELNDIEYDFIVFNTDLDKSESALKIEFIEQQVIDKYNILAWFDDNTEVCNILRDVYGINVMQTGDPNYRCKDN